MTQGAVRALVAVDGSWRSMSMVHYIAGQFEPRKVEIKLFNVHDQLPEGFRDIDKDLDYLFRLSEVKTWDLQQRAHMGKFMDQARVMLERAGFPHDDVKTELHERVRGIARDIMAEAARGYDLVAFARRGLGALQGMILGSVAAKLSTKLVEQPVWLVGRRARPGKVLLASDGSDNGLRVAEHLAKVISTDTAITVFHAVRSASLALEHAMALDELPPNYPLHDSQEARAKHAERVLGTTVDSLVAAGFSRGRIETRLAWAVASRADAIVSESKVGAYGLIAMGRRGVSDIGEFPMGRVTSKVLHLAKGMAVCVVN